MKKDRNKEKKLNKDTLCIDNNLACRDRNNIIAELDNNVDLAIKDMIAALQSGLSEKIKEIATSIAKKIIENTGNKLAPSEFEFYVQKIAEIIIDKFKANLEGQSIWDTVVADSNYLLNQPPLVTEPRLQPVVPIPSAAVMFSSLEAYIRKDLWQKNEQGIAYLQHKAKGNTNNYIEHYITSPGDITLLPWDEAQQIINKFGFTTAKLHLVFAALTMKQERPWQSQFHLKASDIIRDFGWDKNHKKSRTEKLLEITNTAFILDCLLVKAFWVEGKNKKGQIIASAPVGRMWNVYIKLTGQFNLEGKIDKPEEVYITVQPGLWTQDFLNRAGAKSREALYQFGYLAQQVLKIDPYHNELTLRLALYLTLDSRVHLSGEYKVKNLLEAVIPKTVIDSARSDRLRAHTLKQNWDNALKLLIKLGWEVYFDRTYPEWLRPGNQSKKPEGWRQIKIIERLLEAGLTFKQPTPIPELLASKVKPPKAKPKPKPRIGLTNNEIREARKAKGWSQAKLAGFLGVSQNLISLIERGDRKTTPELESKIRKLLCIPD
ncbi:MULTISPECIES: helix-turn-helix domain-containing protein [Aerosakkonema]|uniref:helix-turn-helix domain-containing protein n=1 Tax=Aerosakkonema TaxID=1246629 RepID=UPI0035B9BE5A